MSRRRAIAATALACALALPPGLLGCARTGASAQDTKWRSTATETPQPAQWPPASYVEGLAASRELVREYLRAAASGDRQAMIDAYLPQTRRSAETVVARDLELAAVGGPYAQAPVNTSSVFLFGDGLFPPDADFTVEVEDATRLEELQSVHDDATIVMARFADGTWRPFFVVRDGETLSLVP